MVQIGVCASVAALAALDDWPFDFAEVSVRDALVPESAEEAFAAHLHALARLPVPTVAANVLLPPDLTLVETPHRGIDYGRLERYIRTAIDRAQRAGIEIIVFGSGAARACPDGCRREEATRQIADHLARWSEWSKGSGVRFALEPLRYGETNTINTLAEGAALIQTIADSGATLLADIYHMTCNREPPESLLVAAPLLSHVHASEVQDRAPPGRHGDDFRPFFSVLRQAGYDRRISLECTWHDLQAESGPAVATVRDQWAAAAPGDRLEV